MSQTTFVLLLLFIMILAFASGKFYFGLISLSIPVVLQATGILTAAEAWTGFSNTGDDISPKQWMAREQVYAGDTPWF